MLARTMLATLILAAWGVSAPAEAATRAQLLAKVRTEMAKSFQCKRRDVEAIEIPGTRRSIPMSDAWDVEVYACGEFFIMSATDVFGLKGFDDRFVRIAGVADLACDGEVTVTYLDIHHREVSGCGRTERYRYTGELLRRGEWERLPRE